MHSSRLLNLNISIVFDIERAPQNTKSAIPEQLELEIFLVPPKHGGGGGVD